MTTIRNFEAAFKPCGKLAIYDLASLEKRDEFAFTRPVSLSWFSQDGKKLFLLTANQSVYVLNAAGTK
jgi:hypothetical protein